MKLWGDDDGDALIFVVIILLWAAILGIIVFAAILEKFR